MSDYLSRHPQPVTERDHLEKHVYAVVEAEHAIVWNKIKNAAKEDKEMNLLQTTIQNGRWQDVKQLIKPYYEIRGELFVIDGVVMRMDRIVPPESLRKRIIKVAHNQGHLGISKTKEMIRRKYWFPGMNTSKVKLQYKNVLVVKSRQMHIIRTSEDVKTTRQNMDRNRSTFLWSAAKQQICVSRSGSIFSIPRSRNGNINKYWTSGEETKKIFFNSRYSTNSSNRQRSTFNGKQFEEFSPEMGFQHKKVTPRHPKAQGQVENFNKLIN